MELLHRVLLIQDDLYDEYQELKGKDGPLLEFISSRRILRELINFATVLPPEGSSDSRLYKHPFVATEVLSSDSPLLAE